EEPTARRRAALLRLHAARARGDVAGARAALESFTRHGGDPEQRRAYGSRQASPRELVDETVARAGAARGAAAATSFAPGALLRSTPLAAPDAPEALVRALDRP